MSSKDWIAVVSALIAFISAIFAWCAAHSSRLIAMGQAETTIRSSLRQSRQRVSDLALQVATLLDGRRPVQLTAQDRRRLDALELALAAAIEDELNAYDDACGKYIDGKIDRIRFKKTYVEEIRNVCQSTANGYSQFIHPEGTSKFQPIWKVYREWHVHEK